MLKTKFTEDEKFGLSDEHIKIGTKYLRKNKTAGALKDLEAAKLFELYLLGESIEKIANQFPEYELGQIILTAALRKWGKDREKMTYTLQERVRAKVVKSVIDQVDFLTTMLSVNNAEHMEAMVKYIRDPINNPKPDLRIGNIKEYKDVVETLHKIVSGATPSGSPKDGKPKQSPLFESLAPPQKQLKKPTVEEPEDVNIIDVVD